MIRAIGATAGRLGAMLSVLLGVVVWAASSVETVEMTAGRSQLLEYPADVERISTSNPEVVDVVVVGAREVLLNAKSPGLASVLVWLGGQERRLYSVRVQPDVEAARKLLRTTFPNEPIEIEAAQDTATLRGQVSSKEVAEKAAAIVSGLFKNVVNSLRVEPEPVPAQILLRVRFAEVNRTALERLGLNLISTGALHMPGSITTGQFSPPRSTDLRGTIGGAVEGTTSEWTLSDTLNVFAFRPDLNLSALIAALKEQRVLQILAEPNLVTLDGKEASFLVGGEFPIPTLQGGANAGAVTVQFREFGIRLSFEPHVTPHGTIRMRVRPEVSTIDLANAVSFGGFVIPALSTRRMETEIELGQGQSFVIAGLIDDRARADLRRIPGLSQIPILGELFKSREKQASKTELLVIVTPELVTPIPAGEPVPQLVMPLKFLHQLRPGELLERSSGEPSPSRQGPPQRSKSPASQQPAQAQRR